MPTLRVINPSVNAHPHLPISSPILLAHFPPTRRKSRKLAPRKWSNWTTSCSVSAACLSSASAEYQGWDDPRLGSGSGGSDESNQLIDFMASIGIDDKKYVYVFALGIVCALTISRVRLGWIVVIPASVVVFALGFSFGFVRSVTVSDVDVSGGGAIGRKRIENGDFRLEKLSSVVSFFDKLDARIGRLRDDVNRAVVEKHVTLGELERCVVELDSARSLALPARGVLEACVVELRRAGDRAAESEESAGKKGKEPVESGFGFSKFAAAIFGNKRNESRAGRMKDSKRNGGENELNREVNSGVAGDSLEGSDFNMLHDDREGSEFSKRESNLMQSLDDAKRVRMPQGEKSDPFNFNGASDGFNTREEYSYMRNKMRFADNSRLSFKMQHRNEIESWRSSSSSSERVLDSGDFSYQLKQTETEASFEKEQILNKSVESFESSRLYGHDEEEMNLPRVRRARMPPRDDHFASVADATSSAISSDVLFDRYLTEANDLLKQARDSLKDGDAKDAADDMLYRSSELLSMALDMKPMSLLAVGLLGNSYLLHGELKLKVSRKLRALLRKNRSSRRDWQGRGPDSLDDDQAVNKDKLATLLVNTCEECEYLLVEAGRRYRTALAIDANDVRALYNWGLALSFRAQLIADIGPGAAPEADKVFMAAIDKFDAMMSKGNIYAPDALYRWGAALQQRSHLRPASSKEKVKLLHQAKQLYEDALGMDSDNTQVREALLRCTSELD